MKIQIILELSEVTTLVSAFGESNLLISTEVYQSAEAVIDKIADQLDIIVDGLEANTERGRGW